MSSAAVSDVASLATIIGSSAAPTPDEIISSLASRVESITLTSFGPFLDVIVNPSQEVAEHVQTMLKEVFAASSARGGGSPAGEETNTAEEGFIRHDKGLEVSITRVSRYFTEKREEILERFGKLLGDGSDSQITDKVNFLIHFGVHNGSRNVKVELTGVNCVCWRGTDFEGFRCPTPRPITPVARATLSDGDRVFYPSGTCEAWEPFVAFADVSEEGALSCASAVNGTDLSTFGCIHVDYAPVNAVHLMVEAANREVLGDEKVGDASTVQLSVSHSAGRYLCNFTCYSSLALTSELNAKYREVMVKKGLEKGSGNKYMSLFIHVVAIEDMSAIEQARLITAFLLRWMTFCSGKAE